ncbi:hypothetical protein K3148_00320 [Qipengyuania aurantiaca]|uniref:Endonuclease n=1 Tax=Qipengyuania aurantiaca TaxID=2867233 RepID=A0ABX8ZRU1_9SPHN|nr:hypothetical protein [Qipengyuania aurantiaca]QZD89898.1 hypothetical protein K3148_00320 [Qipengyuania aurantiaca]
MPSQKTTVIEHLFDLHWDQNTQQLRKSLMSLDDVADGIRACRSKGVTLSDRNPANFLKDILRGGNASQNWPASVAAKRYTAVQRTGAGECFEFIPYLSGQTEPFPEEFPVRPDANRYPIQSTSIPLITKSLGRSDETWHIQVAVQLRVVETHFAVAGAFNILELAHLQSGIKLRSTEIDALFLGKTGSEKDPQPVLVTCEAKQAADPLIPSQIINQVQAAFAANEDVDVTIPIGLRTMRGIGFYVVEFEAVKRSDAGSLTQLTFASDSILELRPSVKGV